MAISMIEKLKLNFIQFVIYSRWLLNKYVDVEIITDCKMNWCNVEQKPLTNGSLCLYNNTPTYIM